VKTTDHHFVERFDDEIRRKMKFLDYAPILHISALTGERAPKVLETIDRVADARRKRIPTPALNKFVEEITRANPPVSPGRKRVRILYAAQIGAAPPSFVFFTNVATTFHFSYERFLVNQLREKFGFVGSPIRVQVRRRAKSEPGGRTHRTDGASGSDRSGRFGGSGRSVKSGGSEKSGRSGKSGG
jgi:GTP-binding protein